MFLSVMYQAQLYTILELCRAFDQIFKEHLDGGWGNPSLFYIVENISSNSNAQYMCHIHLQLFTLEANTSFLLTFNVLIWNSMSSDLIQEFVYLILLLSILYFLF